MSTKELESRLECAVVVANAVGTQMIKVHRAEVLELLNELSYLRHELKDGAYWLNRRADEIARLEQQLELERKATDAACRDRLAYATVVDAARGALPELEKYDMGEGFLIHRALVTLRDALDALDPNGQ